MAILSAADARKIIDKILSFRKADELSVSFNGSRNGNIRFARNTITTSGENTDFTVAVTATYGKRSGSATFNQLDDATIEQGVRRAEDAARLAPENAEAMPMLGAQSYLPITTTTVKPVDALFRANTAFQGIDPIRKAGLIAAGILQDSAGFTATGNSKGLFAYYPYSNLSFSCTARTPDGKGSGYGITEADDPTQLSTGTTARIAAQKAKASANARELPPGKYTVILEPAFSEELLSNFMRTLDARNADEGRSFLGKKGGGTRVGETLFHKDVKIWSDPQHPGLPTAPFAPDGRPHERTTWVGEGAVQNVFYSRFWAEKKGVKALPAPAGFVFEGTNTSLEDIIRGTDKGILLTRSYYIRPVDPQTLLYTGLTRDGSFYIENGKIQYAIKNFRFNESPLNMLKNIEAIGQAQRVNGNVVPVLKVKDFNFTSLSDAV
jgi:predicted Zn-dependent protease